MDGRTLHAAMSYPGYDAPLSLSEYEAWAPELNKGLIWAGCTNRFQVAGFLSQIGAESGSFRWTQELASGSEYNGRRDLGNTHPGDGPRFKGRSLIQVTGRNNYGALSRWCHKRGIVPTATYFVDHPTELAQRKWAVLGAVWYWSGKHPHDGYLRLNDAANAIPKKGAEFGNRVMTHMVNGGENNIGGRLKRLEKCLKLGDAILPGGAKPATPPTPARPATPTGEYDMRILQAKETKRFYLFGPGQYVTEISPALAKGLCQLWGTSIQVHSRGFVAACANTQIAAIKAAGKVV